LRKEACLHPNPTFAPLKGAFMSTPRDKARALEPHFESFCLPRLPQGPAYSTGFGRFRHVVAQISHQKPRYLPRSTVACGSKITNPRAVCYQAVFIALTGARGGQRRIWGR
jgi:hypothetical protein